MSFLNVGMGRLTSCSLFSIFLFKSFIKSSWVFACLCYSTGRDIFISLISRVICLMHSVSSFKLSLTSSCSLSFSSFQLPLSLSVLRAGSSLTISLLLMIFQILNNIKLKSITRILLRLYRKNCLTETHL